MNMYQKIAKLGGNGILRSDDLPALETAKGKVLDLMLDGQWHGRDDIEAVGGREGTRRLRELREIRGLYIVRRRREGTREFDYRLEVSGVPIKDEQGYLFS